MVTLSKCSGLVETVSPLYNSGITSFHSLINHSDVLKILTDNKQKGKLIPSQISTLLNNAGIFDAEDTPQSSPGASSSSSCTFMICLSFNLINSKRKSQTQNQFPLDSISNNQSIDTQSASNKRILFSAVKLS